MLGSGLQTKGQNPEVPMQVSKRLERDSRSSPNLFTNRVETVETVERVYSGPKVHFLSIQALTEETSDPWTHF